jgi:hypothetical protein
MNKEMKKASISIFMQQNYKKGAKSSYRSGSKDMQFKLFIRKYTIKDDKVDYLRNDKMCERNKNDIFVSKKPSG